MGVGGIQEDDGRFNNHVKRVTGAGDDIASANRNRQSPSGAQMPVATGHQKTMTQLTTAVGSWAIRCPRIACPCAQGGICDVFPGIGTTTLTVRS